MTPRPERVSRSPRRHPVGSVSEFPTGQMRIVTVDGAEIGIYKKADGTFRAALNICPHRAAPICRGQVTGTMMPSAPGVLEYGMEEQVLRCPWHGFEYDLDTGEPLFGVTRGRLKAYPVTVVDGVVEVSM